MRWMRRFLSQDKYINHILHPKHYKIARRYFDVDIDQRWEIAAYTLLMRIFVDM